MGRWQALAGRQAPPCRPAGPGALGRWRGLAAPERRRPGHAETRLLAARTARRLGFAAEAERHLEACHQLHWPAEEVALERILLAVQNGDMEGVERRLQYFVDVLHHPDTPFILEALAA